MKPRVVEPLGVAGIDGGSVVNVNTRIPPGQEQVDALLGDELTVSKKSQNLVPEEKLGLMRVHIGNRLPQSLVEENPASDEGMNVRVPLEGESKIWITATMPGRAVGSSMAVTIMSRTVS
ncbi:MAG TPA: hypothetical protein VEK15_22320 [Vicinamibacteria bacterium]|nr:hypothetical protein [Vicinamibacteria bacterium]